MSPELIAIEITPLLQMQIYFHAKRQHIDHVWIQSPNLSFEKAITNQPKCSTELNGNLMYS